MVRLLSISPVLKWIRKAERRVLASLPSLLAAKVRAMLFGLTLKTSERDVEIRKGLKSIEIVLLNGFTANHARIPHFLERRNKTDGRKSYSSNCVLIVLKAKRSKACEVVSFIPWFCLHILAMPLSYFVSEDGYWVLGIWQDLQLQGVKICVRWLLIS